MAATNLCADKERLQNAYAAAAIDYSRAVQVLERYVGTLAKKEYNELRSYSEKMRQVSEAARRQLEQHLAEHDC
jgi:hypothetical protein